MKRNRELSLNDLHDTYDRMGCSSHKIDLRIIQPNILNPETFAQYSRELLTLLSEDDRDLKLRERVYDLLKHLIRKYIELNGEGFDTVTFRDLFKGLLNNNIKEWWSRKQLRQLQEWAQLEFSGVKHEMATNPFPVLAEEPSRLRHAEAVLAKRTSRILLVMEKCYDVHNYMAILRTVECMGIQNVWIVLPPEFKNKEKSVRISKGCEVFLTIKFFDSTQQCIDALKEAGRTIWCTDLSPGAVSLEASDLVIPNKLAIVVGREAQGVSQKMLAAADKRVYLPLFGFSESLNVSVATGMVIQRLFALCPDCRGDLSPEETVAVRRAWYTHLGRKSPRRLQEYEAYLENPPPPAESLIRDNKESFVPPHVRAKVIAWEEAEENGVATNVSLQEASKLIGLDT